MRTQGLKSAAAGIAAAAAIVMGLAAGTCAQEAIKLDPQLRDYEAGEGVAGNLSSVGSDTLNNLMTFWAEAFKAHYPNVNVQIEGKGSGTAPPALIGGTAQLGPMSRQMKPSEIDKFEQTFGYKPLEVRVAVDALAVFVNKDNTVKSLSLTQLDAVFSKSRRQGGAKDLVTWGDLGLTGDWAARPISIYGRNSASGTYGFFKEHVLGNGDYKDTVKEQPGSASVVQGISVDMYGIGYSGIGYATPGVRALSLSKKDGQEAYAANQKNAYSGQYPISRYLYVYVNKVPGQPLDRLTREFLLMVLSKEGQENTIKDGYFPIPAKIALEERKKIN